MTKFEELQQVHQHLLEGMEKPADQAAFVREVQSYIVQVCDQATEVPAPRDRDQLRANLRFWASYVYDATGTYPNTTMRPPRPELIVSALPMAPQPEPTPTPARRVPFIWIAALAALGILIVITLLARQPASAPSAGATTDLSQPDRVATQVVEQMIINATLTKVAENRATPTPISTNTPVPTKTPMPTETPTPLPTPTPTSVVVLPGTRIPPTSGAVAPPETLPLGVGYQVLTQGPSPFDPTVWVIQLKLVGIGGNGVYIYWVDGQQLPVAEYTVQGVRCEPQALSVGVTSNGQATRRDISLLSPLADCLKARPQ